MATGAVVVPIVEQFFPTVAEQMYNSTLEEFFEFCKYPHVANINENPDEWDPQNDTLKVMAEQITNHVLIFPGIDTVSQDYNRNIWWDIPASKGYENRSPIALQSHMDMVWDCKGEALTWDPTTHPVSTPIFDKFNGKRVIHTKDWLTSLGADDGQGVALMLSLTKNSNLYLHPRIRCIVTVDEETTARGASRLGWMTKTGAEKVKVLNGIPYLINIDGGPIGQINVSSGGCLGHHYSATFDGDSLETVSNRNLYTVILDDFHGGHSGIDITHHYANPIGLIGKLFDEIENIFREIGKENDIQIYSISSPEEFRTQIPTSASFSFISDNISNTENGWEIAQRIFKTKFDTLMSRYDYSEETKAHIDFLTSTAKDDAKALTPLASKWVKSFVNDLCCGVLERRPEDHAVTASCNIAPFNFEYDFDSDSIKLEAETLARFNTHKKSQQIIDKNAQAFYYIQNFVGKEKAPDMRKVDEFPVWEESKDKYLCNLCYESFQNSNIRDPYFYICHPGLECSFFVNDYKDLVQISIGANVLNEHTTDEMLELDSYWQLINSMLHLLRDYNPTV